MVPTRRRSRNPAVTASFAVVSLAVSAALAPTDALAHGGAYKGPPGEIPPDSRDPSDPPPPPEGGPPGTPGGDTGGGPTTGTGGGGGGPTTGDGGNPGRGPGNGPPPSGPGGGSGGVTTGGGPTRGSNKQRGLEDWTFWWHANDDALLGLRKASRARRRATPGSAAHAFGSQSGAGTQVLDPTRAAVNLTIVPALRGFLADRSLDADIRSAAALGLAKIGDAASVPELLAILRARRGEPRIVEETAALALGLYPEMSREVRESLLEVAADPNRDGSHARPFAAIALGLAKASDADRAATSDALLAIVRGKEPGIDVKPCALQAVGLLGDPSAIDDLLDLARGAKSAAKLSDADRGHAVHALGRIGAAGAPGVGRETAVLDALLELASDASREPDVVKRPATIALGRIAARTADPKLRRRVVSVLDQIVAGDAELQQRHYALIAIGRIAAAAADDEPLRAACVRKLRHTLDKGRPTTLTPPFAGLALGLVGRDASERGTPLADEEVGSALRRSLDSVKDAKTRAAYAVALGLVVDGSSTETLREILAEGRNEARLRGYAALALGMIGAPDAHAPVRAALAEPGDRELRVLASMGAGLLGDPKAVETLVSILRSKDESQYVLGSAALALGRIGDENAVGPLLAVASEPKYAELTRALAVVALGQIGDRSDVPVLARFAEDIDYRTASPAIGELLTIL